MISKRKVTFGQVSDSDLRQLRIFKVVVEGGGFHNAAIALNVSRPAISIAISDLEKRLGLRLAHRSRGGFSLTDEGREVYQLILQLFTSLETFKSQVNALHDCLKGEFNIGITDNLVTIEHMDISNALASLKHPGSEVLINIRMAPPVDVEQGVIDGKLHIGVVPQLRKMAVLDYFPLYQETSFLYCSNTHPLFDISEVNESSLLNSDAVISSYAKTMAINDVERELFERATATDREGIAFLILTGAYIGFLPSHFAERWVNKGEMKQLLPDRFFYITDYVAITRKNAHPNIVVETFLEQLV